MASAINVDLADAEGFQQALDLYHRGRQLGMGSMIEPTPLWRENSSCSTAEGKAKILRFPGQQVKKVTGQFSPPPPCGSVHHHQSHTIQTDFSYLVWFTLSFAV